ncbi:helix-turn-helix domain-containing protein [Brochothrix thermosphacta]|uniref:HTH cro/C1-type domain-containing protein n=1 Tax=Brochothrix thermosphacta TaxID=2756 RepID=A0A1D2LX34_BROTH|nr:helix-turn-helix domain-containing protein [Brochothrix thermosphacta]ATF26401.1 hypothetical protein CNY62_08420 [Brochothrix thermosphacta]ATH85741.1 hypothetical protein CPF12_08015 [Brochothrix thermosphacta]MPQ28788.1 helix-turn-helix domain-containing protein [Brochothrix thermosphacta]ODJ51088.1 hypothetical protein BFR40_08425 [Brochothrix thermosphacta]ODJ54100.1 hypothetical protein BFR38_02680 [Brochothrix thermosphacta]
MIANNLAALLAERKIKITRLAKETGISRSTLTSIAQNDTKMIQLEVINQICMYLEITPEDFFVFVPIDVKITHEISNLQAGIEKGLLNFEFELDLFFDFITKKGTDTFEVAKTVSSKHILHTDEGTSVRLIIDMKDNSALFAEYERAIPTALRWNYMDILNSELSTSLSEALLDYFSQYFDVQDIILNTDFEFKITVFAMPF